MLSRRAILIALACLLATAAVAQNRFRIGFGVYTQTTGGMTWAQMAAQPGVLVAVEMSSYADISTTGIGTTFIHDAGFNHCCDGFVTYDASKNGMRINVPTNFGAPGLGWTKSLPYAQQFDQNSDLWLQFDSQWDAGMVTPSINGGGFKYFSIDAGNSSDGTLQGSCDNYMEGQVVGTVQNVIEFPKWLFSKWYHTCNSYIPVDDPSTAIQDQRSQCYFGFVNALPSGSQASNCIYFTTNVWHTWTVHLHVGTWGTPTTKLDVWVSRPGLPTTFLESSPGFQPRNDNPGTAKYGKIWLFPYDTNRTSSTVDGNVWYRHVLIASQALQDPTTCQPFVAGQAPSTTNICSGGGGQFPSLADNSWLALTPNTSSRYIPTGDPTDSNAVTVPGSPTVDPTPQAREFGGFVYGGGKLYYFGGGHLGYAGNDVDVYNIATNIWVQAYKPEVCLNVNANCGAIYTGSSTAFVTANDRPYTEHMFAKSLWNPSTNHFDVAARGGGLYTYDPSGLTLTRVPVAIEPGNQFQLPWSGDISGSHALWSPTLSDRLVFITIAGGATEGVYQQTGAGSPKYFVKIGTNPGATSERTLYSTWVASKGEHLMVSINNTGPKLWYWFNAGTVTWTAITIPSGLDVADEIQYDSHNDMLIAIRHTVNPVQLWKCTPVQTPVCTTLTLTGAPTSNAGASSDERGAMPLWQYDAEDNVFWYAGVTLPGTVSGGEFSLWAYRFKN